MKNDKWKWIFSLTSLLLVFCVVGSRLRGGKEANPPIILNVGLNDIDGVRTAVENDSSLLKAVDMDGHTPLHVAAEHGYPEMVDLLLSHGADPNRTDREGFTPLAYSLLCQSATRPQIVKALIAAGARTDVAVPPGESVAEFDQAAAQLSSSR